MTILQILAATLVAAQPSPDLPATPAVEDKIESVVRSAAPPLSIRGSPAAMAQQHQVAVAHDLAFHETRASIEQALSDGELVRLSETEDYEVADFVDPPYVHPAAALFVERTARLYRQACGERLVVTSGVRASESQPPNSHALSVHPTGMAVDLRVSQQESCREWLEAKLLELEERGLLNGIRENRPPHYHVAVFPQPYMAYAEEREAMEEQPAAEEISEAAEPDRAMGTVVVLAVLMIGAAAVAWRWRRRGKAR